MNPTKQLNTIQTNTKKLVKSINYNLNKLIIINEMLMKRKEGE